MKKHFMEYRLSLTTRGGWIVDSGASSHMTQTRQFLVDYEGFDKPQKVYLGDGRTVEAFGRGNTSEWSSR